MRLLDLYCGAGGAAVGYHRAGYTEILGVDVEPQPRYPFPLLQTDALTFLAHLKDGRAWDLIHASPPCQAYSTLKNANRRRGREYPDHVAAVRAQLRSLGRPWVIENVPGAPLIDAILLCGLTFGLKVFRHRLFECSEFLLQPPHLTHGHRVIGADGWCCVVGNGGNIDRKRRAGPIPKDHRRLGAWQAAMGIDWMNRYEITQAVPPAYTEWLGQQLLAHQQRRP